MARRGNAHLFAATGSSRFECYRTFGHATEFGEKGTKVSVGLTVYRRGGNAYPQVRTVGTHDFVATGTWLDLQGDDQRFALPVVPGC